jgi:hypothetical protein
MSRCDIEGKHNLLAQNDTKVHCQYRISIFVQLINMEFGLGYKIILLQRESSTQTQKDNAKSVIQCVIDLVVAVFRGI